MRVICLSWFKKTSSGTGKKLDQGARRMKGVVIGIVTNNNDPEKIGRMKVTFPWLSEDNETDWVRMASLMAGQSNGNTVPQT